MASFVSVERFLSPAGPMSGPVPHVYKKFISVPEVWISILSLISVIESLIVLIVPFN